LLQQNQAARELRRQAWLRRRTLLMCILAARSLQDAAATAPPPPNKKKKTEVEGRGIAHSGWSGGGGAEGAPQAAHFELKPVTWAAFLGRYGAVGQPAGAGAGGENTGPLGEFLARSTKQFLDAGGGDGDANARLGEFLASHVPEDEWLCGVLAYL